MIDLFISTVKTNKASDRLFLRGVMIKPPVRNTPADRPRWQRERERERCIVFRKYSINVAVTG